jgi:hypothetical protein
MAGNFVFQNFTIIIYITRARDDVHEFLYICDWWLLWVLRQSKVVMSSLILHVGWLWLLLVAGYWPGFWLCGGFWLFASNCPKPPPEKYPWRLDGSAKLR